MRKAIVTGGAGFIGSHLADRLLEEGFTVSVIDNFSTGRPENLAHQKNNKNLNVIEADISDFDKIAPYFKGADAVFHLAALADIVPSITNPLNYYKSNVTGTMSVIEASRISQVKRFIYSAPSSCYGILDVCSAEKKENTKYMGEQIVLHWGKVYKLPAVSLRLFNVYGPRSRTSGAYGAVFGVFLAQKLNKKPFTVVGDGAQTRDFVYVTDVINAFFMAFGSDCKNEIMNVGSGNTYSINELVKLLNGDVVYMPKRPGEPDCTLADIAKIKRILGWETKISFRQGVKAMLDNIDYWRNAPVWSLENIKEATKDWFQYLS